MADKASLSSARVCIVAAVPLTLFVFMRPHVTALSQHCQITLVADGSPNSIAPAALLGEHISFRSVKIERDVSLFADLMALVVLWRLFRKERFHIVHSISPKAGLLAMIAGALGRVPIRIHWFTGQVWATRRGGWRWILKNLDRLLASCATHLLADSSSQRVFLANEGVVSQGRVTVLGRGSVCGVDVARFRPDKERGAGIRASLGIPEDAVVALYVGRLARDKGVLELASAFLVAAQQCANLHLLLAGPDEAGMGPLMAQSLSTVSNRVHFVGFTNEPEVFMAAADFFMLPSHREGFGSSVIEAAASGIPTVASRIYGLTDAIIDGETGVLVPVGDVNAIARAMIRLATDPALRLALGNRARARVNEDFKQEMLTDALLDYYTKCLGQRAGEG